LATVCTLSVGAGALFLVTPPAAQGKELASAPTAQGVADKKVHRLVLQVNTNEPATMNLALNNATNVEQYYKKLGERWRSRSSPSVPACICCATTPRR
jgi:hypothetical protein